jgi:hypothetical protein
MNYASDAADALSWYDRTVPLIEPSDETILAQRERFSVVESSPAPLNLTDTERVEWLGEYCDKYEYIKPKHVIIDCMGQRTIDANFRDAIDAAAAKFKEANGE